MCKFIYVFDKESRDRLLAEQCTLLKSDEAKNIFVFQNKDSLTFSVEKLKCVFSNILTF